MRGKGGFASGQASNLGITPAYAGKRNENEKLQSVSKDHPRLCGEKHLLTIISLYHTGSPPPMRGKAAISRRRMSRIRITPAYAGKRQLLFDARRFFRDHPRLCGEKSKSVTTCPMSAGSPPPMRGKATRANLGYGNKRITPAYAGKSAFGLYILSPP